MTKLARIRWHCRRGMRELDVLLEGYLEHHYDAAIPSQQAAFERLLEMQDPVILRLLLGRDVPVDAELEKVVGTIRRLD